MGTDIDGDEWLSDGVYGGLTEDQFNAALSAHRTVPRRTQQWYRINHKRDGRHSLSLFEFDCKARQLRLLRSIVYASDDRLLYADADAQGFQAPAPDSMAERIVNEFCGADNVVKFWNEEVTSTRKGDFP